MAQGERLAGVARFLGTRPNQVDETRGDTRERQQIEAIVLEHRHERPRVAGAHELKIARRNLEAWHVADAPGAEHLPPERDERTGLVLRARAADAAIAPEAPGRMQHVDVRQARPRPLEAMEKVTHLEDRRVERFAVEAHDRASALQLASHGREQRPLVGKAEQHVLPRDEAALLVERAEADEKGICAGAAAQAGGFEIEEEEGRTRRRAAGDERRLRPSAVEPRRQLTHRRASVQRPRARPPLDHETGAVGVLLPSAAKDAFEIGARRLRSLS